MRNFNSMILRFLPNFSANHPDSGWLAHIRHYNLSCLPRLFKDIAVEKLIIVTINKKSCKRILICGSACICSLVFELFCIYHHSFPGVLQANALLYCVGTSRFGISWIAFETSNSTNSFKNVQVNCVKKQNQKSLVDELINSGIIPFKARIRISRIECKRRLDKTISRICSKSCSNWICSASCFRERSRFFTEIKLSKLQIWHLENRTEKKIWHNSFKNLLQKLFKLNLQCVMLSREKPFFDWNQIFCIRFLRCEFELWRE